MTMDTVAGVTPTLRATSLMVTAMTGFLSGRCFARGSFLYGKFYQDCGVSAKHLFRKYLSNKDFSNYVKTTMLFGFLWVFCQPGRVGLANITGVLILLAIGLGQFLNVQNLCDQSPCLRLVSQCEGLV